MNTKEMKDFKFIFLLFLIDTISKMFIKINLTKESIVIPSTLSLTFVKNTGVAFSFLADWSIYFVSFISIVIIFFLFSLYVKETNRHSEIGLLLIMGGAVSNLFDRLLTGYVTDFINVVFIEFPVFNLADVFITLGVIILIFQVKRTKKI